MFFRFCCITACAISTRDASVVLIMTISDEFHTITVLCDLERGVFLKQDGLINAGLRMNIEAKVKCKT